MGRTRIYKGQIKRAITVCVLLAAFFYVQNSPTFKKYFPKGSHTSESSPDNNSSLINAFKNQLSNQQVTGSGTVVKVLNDDNTGSRHQKFILRISPNLTILIAHNIDLAPRISSLKRGDTIKFCGEYEWNQKGGVVHWTHHDPNGRHQGGWLQKNGKKYQ